MYNWYLKKKTAGPWVLIHQNYLHAIVFIELFVWSKFEQNGKTVHNSYKFLFYPLIYPQAINRQCEIFLDG